MTSVVRIYDIDRDEFRPVTQADVDGLLETANAYAKLIATMRTVHSEYQSKLKSVRTRAENAAKAGDLAAKP